MNDILLYIFIFSLSLVLTEIIRRCSLKNDFLDVPNNRSSHTTATPRVGGIAIVFTFLISVLVFYSDLPINLVFSLLGGGAFVAVIGFWDDQDHIAAKWRLFFHFVAGAWVLYNLGPLPEFKIYNYPINLGWFGYALSAISLVWMLNLFNFMDGIDGIAASETIFIAYSGAYFSWLYGFESISFILMILASSTMGFLIFNWPPAKIFMGDVGSGFLGLMIGVIAYASILKGISVWLWLILLAVFLVDSGITLLRRMVSGEKWHEAHCSHAYQHAAKKWGHVRVTISVIILNLFFLFPFAYLTYLNPNMGMIYTLLTFAPLILIALKFKAGINIDNNVRI